MSNRWRNGKVYGAVVGIGMGALVMNFYDELVMWRVDSHTWSRDACEEGSSQRVALDALVALRDDAPPRTWCDLARDEEACLEDFDAWYEELVRPVALQGTKCLMRRERASFAGGGARPHEVEGGRAGEGSRAVLICDGLDERLEIVTVTKSTRVGEEDHKLVSMGWVKPDPS